jgi:N-acetylmuramoyl-L-alanine amidase
MSPKKFLTFSIILLIIGEISFFSTFSAAAPRDAYYDAEACYRSLRQNSQKIKYRHHWMRCIKKYQSVYNQDPDGPWAAAGLYRSAKMYQALAKFSGKQSDQKEARDIFERVVQKFPNSRYRQKASREITIVSSGTTLKKTPPKEKPFAAKGLSPKQTYITAEG